MTYSFTERKRIRKNFGKRPSILDVPYLLATQINSYKTFLQRDVEAAERTDQGLNAAFSTVFPIVSYSGYAALEYVRYRLGEPAFDLVGFDAPEEPGSAALSQVGQRGGNGREASQ